MTDPNRIHTQPTEVLVTIYSGEDEDTAFPATIDTVRHNGAVIPHFHRAAAEAVVAWLNLAHHTNSELVHGYWEGDTVVLHGPIAADGATMTIPAAAHATSGS